MSSNEFTDRQFEMIGRLTLAFNDIEEIIDIYFPFFLSPDNPMIGYFVINRQRQFNTKYELFRDLLDTIVREQWPIAETAIDALLGVLKRASELAVWWTPFFGQKKACS